MIIEKNDMIVAKIFLENLDRSMKGVLRISTGNELCTGWLLTEKLVVIPDYIGDEKTNFICNPWYEKSPETIEARLVYRTSKGKGDTPAIIELNTPVKFPAQVLQIQQPDIGDSVFIVHHPLGDVNSYLSFGKIIPIDLTLTTITYDASTQPGSTGSPVINSSNGKIIGMHVKANPNPQQRANSGLTISFMLECFRKSAFWEEIIKYHKIADIRSTATEEKIENNIGSTWKNIHLKAALSWNLNRSSLSKQEQDELKPFIVDPSSHQWTIKPSDRQQILQSVPVAELKTIKLDGGKDQQEQKVVKRILNGGPYNLDEISEKELPLWLQAVRWFAPLDKNLPSSSEVNRVLEKKRVRSRLAELGSNFAGREKELKELNTWYRDDSKGPMVVSGIGGIGKSALISHFTMGLPEDTPILWLDFDRADLAPDDARSIFKILAEQLLIQVPNFVAPESTDNWQETAKQLGQNLSKALPDLPPPFLVMDGFEVAQQVKEYQKIWDFLKFFIDTCPRLKVIVSGRAPVSSLSLGGKSSAALNLTGMEKEDAMDWLKKQHITNTEIAEKVIDISKGIPLVLKLAVHFVESGNKIEELPATLPKTVVEGYLYQRILDRVMDEDLKPIAKKALVLRKISVQIIEEILPADIPDGSTAEKTFERLSREFGLVRENQSGSMLADTGEQGILQLRPEVRAATIKLLEIEDSETVKDIDQKAFDFYTKQDLTKNENTAEVIYHALRLGRIKDAEAYWRVECAPLLKDATDDLPETAVAERKWLQEKKGQVISVTGDDIRIWEINTLKQINDMIGRGLFNQIQEILSARTERSENSPLLLYDAWAAGMDNKLRTIEILAGSKANNPIIKRNENILRALTEAQTGNIKKADHFLAELSNTKWDDRKNSKYEALALYAARVRFTVDLESELAIAELIRNNQDDMHPAFIKDFLASRYIVLPSLSEKLEESWQLESLGSNLTLPKDEKELYFFEESLKSRTPQRMQMFDISMFDISTPDIEGLYERNKGAKNRVNNTIPEAYHRIIDLALLGHFRWNLAATYKLLAQFANIASNKEEVLDPLELSIIATLTAFRGQEMTVYLEGSKEPTIDTFLMRVSANYSRTSLTPISNKQGELLVTFIKNEMFNSLGGNKLLKDLEHLGQNYDHTSFTFMSSLRLLSGFAKDPAASTVMLYLISPDPLEMLCKRIIGLPDNYKF